MSNIQELTSYPDSRRFRLTREPEAPNWREDWERRGRPEPFCEFTVLIDSQNEPYLISYGGELWPLAWPSLFVKRSTYTTGLTQKGKELIS